MWTKTLAGMLTATVLIASPVSGEQNSGSANRILPGCKTWLRVASEDIDAVTNEIAAGSAAPGGLPAHFTKAGMCAGIILGIAIGMECIPEGVTNEQVVRVVVDRIEKSPELMNQRFGSLVMAVVTLEWRCGNAR
jgi:hypothetical protein